MYQVHCKVWNLQAEPGTAETGKVGEAADPAKRLRNQFNFSERGAQTTYFQPRERETSTDTPETVEASGTCSHWEIYDAYVADQKMQRQQVRDQGGPAYLGDLQLWKVKRPGQLWRISFLGDLTVTICLQTLKTDLKVLTC